MTDLHKTLDDILRESVISITGHDYGPRPGQRDLAHDILTAMENNGRVSGVGPTGLGKALWVETPIPTPTGWTRMGDLRVGDEVFDRRGRVTKVIGAFDVQHGRPCYEVIFSDKSSIIADDEHLWFTTTRAERSYEADVRRSAGKRQTRRLIEFHNIVAALSQTGPIEVTLAEGAKMCVMSVGDFGKMRTKLGGHRLRKNEKFDIRPLLEQRQEWLMQHSVLVSPRTVGSVKTTADIRATLDGQGGAANHAIPVAGAIDLPHADLPIDPYVLGVWLGDGGRRSIGITSEDQFIIDEVVSAGYPVRRSYNNGSNADTFWFHGLTHAVRHLYGSTSRRPMVKSIPMQYLRASVDQRLALLQGLMDTGGTVRTDGYSEFCVATERLARDTFELVQSLGIKATFRTGPAVRTTPEGKRVHCGTRYRVGFTTSTPVFRLPRKLERLPQSERLTQGQRYIKDVRPVPSVPVRCIRVDNDEHLFLAGESFIPTHNTVSLLAPAMTVAVLCNERTLLSTESLSLQHQYLDKDAPVVAGAVEKVTGERPSFAVHKGFSNHVCSLAAFTTSAEALGLDIEPPKVNTVLSESVQRGRAVAAMTDIREAVLSHSKTSRRKPKVGGKSFTPEFFNLLAWATDPEGDGDRARYKGDVEPGAWGLLSMTPQECPGANGCPFATVCLPRQARQRASEADVVVTNHHLLGIQAASAAPVVLGNRKLGNFRHLMVDEAHGLPGIVRSGGAVDIGPRRMGGVIAAVNGVVDAKQDKDARGLIDSGNDIADHLERVLGRIRGLTPTTPVLYTPDMTDLADSLAEVKGWADAAKGFFPDQMPDMAAYMKLIRAKSRVERLSEDVDAALSDNDLLPQARWVEDGPYGRSFKSSPVDVSAHIAANLFSAKLVPDRHIQPEETFDEEGNPIKVPLSVTMVSATMPKSFRRDTGIGVDAKEYPSPFDSAYGRSMVYCPKPTADDLPLMASQYNGRWKFDTAKHADWATEQIVELVTLNGGSALVLSANKRNGEQYAKDLRQRTGLTVHSQWDGRDPRLIVDEWRSDVGSVMVGTRSLMTGVDAKGETCTMVIIDRVPRASGNVVDDARVKAVAEAMETDRWSADKYVYVSDAALLLEQAVGRLIRTMDDHGVAVCLDPRIVPGSPLSYRRDVSDIYLSAMRRFEKRRFSMASVIEHIKENQ